MSAARQHLVNVDDETIVIWVAKDGKSYKAWGDFRGKQISTRESTSSEAINQWRYRANHMANE